MEENKDAMHSEKQPPGDALEVPVNEFVGDYNGSLAYMEWLGVTLDEYVRDHAEAFVFEKAPECLTEEARAEIEARLPGMYEKYHARLGEFLKENGKGLTLGQFVGLPEEIRDIILRHKLDFIYTDGDKINFGVRKPKKKA